MPFKTITATVDVFDDIFADHPKYDLEEGLNDNIIHTTHDILVVSSALYRLKTTTPLDENGSNEYFYMSLKSENKSIVEKITDEDYDLAEQIRKYYAEKIIFSKLRGERLTKYREDLGTFVTKSVDPVKCPEKMIGMVYKLPYFYEYDNKLRNVFETDYKTLSNNHARGWEEKTLTFIDKLDTHRKRSTVVEYWCKDEADNRVVLEMEKHNPVMSLWEHALKNPIEIRANYESRRKDSLEYYIARAWKTVDN